MLIAAGVVVSALAGCDETVDDAHVEDFVRDNAQAPALIESVDCPDDVEIDEGDTFECRIHTKGDGLETVTLRQVEDERVVPVATRQVRLPSGGDLRIIPENVEGFVRAQAPEPERVVSIDCPPDVPIEKGRRFECVVRFDDGSRERVAVVQRDDLGNLELAPAGKRR
jgi:NAD(P)H-hydrate repair Nnr-like enzyme with NAD(P)H-hydrate epimerase domain